MKTLERMLQSTHAKLSAWQVRALFLGAQASTNVQLGPQHLFGHIFGDPPSLGDSKEEMNANLRVLMETWNELVPKSPGRPVRVSVVPVSSPPSAADLVALARRRTEEIASFLQGIEAGGDLPIEFGAEGQRVLEQLATTRATCAGSLDSLLKEGEYPKEQLSDTAAVLGKLTTALEDAIGTLLQIGAQVRLEAIAELRARQGRGTDDGLPPARAVRVGRNDPCPCGSGKKWKRCCGMAGA